MSNTTDLECWQAFLAVVDGGGVARAAERLGVAKSMISRRLTKLEQRLGVALMTRTTRRLTLTDTGIVFAERARALLADVAELERAVSREHAELTGRLRVSVPLTFGLRYVSPCLNRFMQMHPGIELDVEFSDRRVHVIEESVDLALRIGPLEDSALIVRRLCPIRFLACASPAYIAQHATPRRPEDLARHRFLAFSGLTQPHLWTFKTASGRSGSVKLPVHLRANNGDHLVAAAEAGLGVLIEPTFIVEPAIVRGSLTPLLRNVQWRVAEANVLYPRTRHLNARVRALIDHLTACFSTEPVWDARIAAARRAAVPA